MRHLAFLLALWPVSAMQIRQPDPAEFARQIKELEVTAAANIHDLASRDTLIRMYHRAIHKPSLGIREDVASVRIRDILLQMIKLDPRRMQTAQLSRSAVKFRDASYPVIREAWLDAAKGGDPAVMAAAATALSPSIDHQEILRLVGNPTDPALTHLFARALAAAFSYGDPAQSAAAQTRIRLLSDPDQIRTVSSMILLARSRLWDDPTRRTEDLNRMRDLVQELNKSVPPTVTLPVTQVPRRITIGGGAQKAMVTHSVDPEYPQEAAAARISGVVKFAAIIGKDGKIVSLQLLSGHPLLVPAATKAVHQWEYKPTQVNGEPVEVVTQIEVPFAPPN